MVASIVVATALHVSYSTPDDQPKNATFQIATPRDVLDEAIGGLRCVYRRWAADWLRNGAPMLVQE
eukprot:9227716-Pyramimonas_sp.AAC.1